MGQMKEFAIDVEQAESFSQLYAEFIDAGESWYEQHLLFMDIYFWK